MSQLQEVQVRIGRFSESTKRLSIFLYKLSKIALVSRLADITNHNKMSLWRNHLKLLKSQCEKYVIPAATHLSMGEVYARSHHKEAENRNDRFFTVITDLNSHKVLWVSGSRSKKTLDDFFVRLGPEKCCLIEAVATDDHDDFASSIKEHCPNAIRILDRFHLMRYFEEAVNDNRKLLYKMLPQKEVRELAKPRYRFIFLKRESTRTPEEQEHMDKVMKDNEAFTRLEVVKERMITFFNADNKQEALDCFFELEDWAKESGFKPIVKFCAELRKR